MVTTTTVYGFQKPAVAGDEDAWGGYLNNNIDKYESILTGNTTITNLVITTASVTGDFTVDTSTLHVDSSNNRVGVGTTSPSRPLQVTDATSDGTGGFKIESYLPTLEMDDISGGGTSFILQHDGTSTLFKHDTTERMRIDSSGNVGIGASTVDQKLHLEESDTTSVFLKTQNSAGALLVGNNSAGNSFVSSQTSGKSLLFETANTERMRIDDSSGSLLVGRTTTSDTNVGGMIRPDGFIQSTRDGNIAADFNRNTSDGELVRFSKGSSPKGAIGVSADGPAFGTTTQQVAFHADRMFPCQSYGSALDATIDLGYSGSRFKDIWLSSGIKNSGDLIVDSGGNIHLDADGGNITFKDAGTQFGKVRHDGSNTAEFYGTNNIHLRAGDGTNASTNYVWNQGHASPWSNNYYDLGNNTYGWRNAYIVGAIYHQGDDDTYLQFHNPNEFRIVTGNTEMLEVNDTNIQLSAELYLNGNGIQDVANIYVRDNVAHQGDTDTLINFTDNLLAFKAGNSTNMYIAASYISIYAPLYNYTAYFEEAASLSGTSVTINAAASGVFYLTMSGNTTFTFTNTSSNWGIGFTLYLTGNGGTVAWDGNSTTVRWAGGTAPDAPASGETDVYVFHTRDGSTWYGALAIDAAS